MMTYMWLKKTHEVDDGCEEEGEDNDKKCW